MFEPSLDVEKPTDVYKTIKNRRVEGIRLARMTPTYANRIDIEAFIEYFMLFSKHHNFIPSMDPFMLRSHVPE